MINRSDIKTITNNIFESDYPKIDITQFLENWLVTVKKVNIFDAQEIIDKNIAALKTSIKHKIEKHEKELTTSKYIFSDYDEKILLKKSLTVSPEYKHAIENKLNWRDKVAKLICDLSWREFELLSKIILKQNGISDITITQSQNDQGIDFYGYFKPSFPEGTPRFHKNINLRIVGQVKHSINENKVNHTKVSSFGTEVNRLRKKNPPQYFKNLTDDFFSSEFPLVGIFIANALYLPKAESFANDYGIIIWNGEQISEDLSSQEFITEILDLKGNLSLSKLQRLL